MSESLFGSTLVKDSAGRVASRLAIFTTANFVGTTSISLTLNPKRMDLCLKERSAVQ